MRFSLVMCLLLTICCPLNYAQEQELNLNFVNTDLEIFINFVAKQTSKRILYDSTIRGRKIFLVSATPVSKEHLYKIFLSVMEYNGYILESTGVKGAELLKIKRNIVGPWTQTRTIYSQKELETIQKEDQFITMVIKLKYISAREVQTTLRALRIVNPQGGNLAGIEGSNTILITDFAPNVRRIHDVIKMMDQQGPEKEFEVIKLKHAVAEEVVEKLSDFVTKQTSSRGIGLGPNLEEVKVVADRRLNAVIVQAYNQKMKRMKKLIQEIDQKLDEEPSNIHYIRLKHADATKLQETLAKLLETGGLTKKTVGGNTGTSSVASQDKIATSVQAEPQTNSLIIRAENHEWREIRKIVEQVDVRRPQVLIEGALVEISPESALGLGVELFWAESAKNNDVTFGGGSDFGFSNLVAVDDAGEATVINSNTTSLDNVDQYGKVPVSTRSDFARGATGFMNYKDIFTIPAIIKAIKTQGDFKVISMPSVLTNDHEKASINVADANPSSSTTENNSGSVTDSFQGYEQAGTTLVITPHISGEKNYLRLEVEQSIDEFVSSQNVVGGVPPKRVREIKTSITIPDGHTVAIGGFTFDSHSETIEKIPFLGDLPILGLLFQTRVVTHRKRNIYLFITPHILREPNFRDLHKHSYEYKLKAQKLGANINMFDKSFNKYKNKYGLGSGSAPPVYMLEYKTPNKK